MTNDELNWHTHVIANVSCFDFSPYLLSAFPWDYDTCIKSLNRASRFYERLSKVIPQIETVNTNRARRLRGVFYTLRDSFWRLPDDLREKFCPTMLAPDLRESGQN